MSVSMSMSIIADFTSVTSSQKFYLKT